MKQISVNRYCIYLSIVILLVFGIMQAGCSKKDVDGGTSNTDSSDIVMIAGEDGDGPGNNEPDTANSDMGDSEEEERTDNNLGTEEEDVASQETIRFVDVFGEEYEVKLNPDIPRHNYISGNFIHSGDKLSYEDESYTSRLGVDVSYHQGSIDWKAVAEDGYEFAVLRIAYRGYGEEGKLKEDPKFEEYYAGAKEAGLDIGVYFFSQAINEEEALEEADMVLDILDGRELELPVTYDPESILDDVARTDNVSGEQFTRNTEVFCGRIKEAGYDPMIYSNMLWEAYNLDLVRLKGIPVWYADYEPYPQTPYSFVFWQYCNEAKVKGISGSCDVDIELIT